jgi:hypothetical protein
VKAQNEHVSVVSPLLTKNVTLDGKFSYSDEWNDTSKVTAGTSDDFAVMKVKHDEKFLYTLIEYPTKHIIMRLDNVNLMWALKDVRGPDVGHDDLQIAYVVQRDLWEANTPVSPEYKISYAMLGEYGTPGRWPTNVGNWALNHPQWEVMITSTPDYQTPHQVWEIRTPFDKPYFVGDTPVKDVGCNPNHLASQPFDATVGNVYEQSVSLTNSDWINPDTWGTLSYSGVPIPEFDAPLILLPMAILVCLLVFKNVARSRRHHSLSR